MCQWRIEDGYIGVELGDSEDLDMRGRRFEHPSIRLQARCRNP